MECTPTKCLVCCDFLFSVKANGLNTGPRARNSCSLNLLLKPSVFWTSPLTWLHPRLSLEKWGKKFLLSNFLYKIMARINYLFKGLCDSLLRSSKITHFLLSLINFPKLCTLHNSSSIRFWGFLINKWHYLSTDIQRNTNWEAAFPFQKSGTKSWLVPELGSAARSPFRQTLAHAWYKPHHISSLFCCWTPQIQHSHLPGSVISSLNLPDITIFH